MKLNFCLVFSMYVIDVLPLFAPAKVAVLLTNSCFFQHGYEDMSVF